MQNLAFNRATNSSKSKFSPCTIVKDSNFDAFHFLKLISRKILICKFHYFSDLPLPSIPENPDLFNLQAQIQHKIDFIAKNIDKNEQEVILIGHSIGAKMALGVMDSGVANVTAGYMLFPTIGKTIGTLISIVW